MRPERLRRRVRDWFANTDAWPCGAEIRERSAERQKFENSNVEDTWRDRISYLSRVRVSDISYLRPRLSFEIQIESPSNRLLGPEPDYLLAALPSSNVSRSPHIQHSPRPLIDLLCVGDGRPPTRRRAESLPTGQELHERHSLVDLRDVERILA